MLRLGQITHALHGRLSSDPGVIQVARRIEEAGYVNTRPDQAPWIGVYDAQKTYDPRTLGRHSGSWNGQVQLNVVVQEVSYRDGVDARDRLENLLELVEQCVVDDPTIGGTVDRVLGLSVDYAFRREEFETVYFREAVLTIEAEAATG
jgi:hypothetical protein